MLLDTLPGCSCSRSDKGGGFHAWHSLHDAYRLRCDVTLHHAALAYPTEAQIHQVTSLTKCTTALCIPFRKWDDSLFV